MATLKLGTTTAITESSGALTLANTALGTPTSVTLTNATFPAGHVLQVVIDVDNDYETHAADSWDTVHSINIPNVKSGSHVHIMASINTLTEASGLVAFQIIDSVGGVVAKSQNYSGGTSSWHSNFPSMMGKDTSPLVGSNTYTIQMRPSGTFTAYYNYGSNQHQLTQSYYQLMEVVA